MIDLERQKDRHMWDPVPDSGHAQSRWGSPGRACSRAGGDHVSVRALVPVTDEFTAGKPPAPSLQVR